MQHSYVIFSTRVTNLVFSVELYMKLGKDEGGGTCVKEKYTWIKFHQRKYLACKSGKVLLKFSGHESHIHLTKNFGGPSHLSI